MVGLLQEKSAVGDFTKSPTEQIIVEIERPFEVRAVKGVVRAKSELPDDPLPNVLFEIQGPGNDKKIRRTTTDKSGRFSLSHIPQGTYRFKATLDGFQSVMGTIVISRHANRHDEIRIEMPFGV